uniref:Uncharacterized protein n=1 Tax=viral metagenome TaxID=1070528 RepID=A0A6C0E3N5_9ZZZZ
MKVKNMLLLLWVFIIVYIIWYSFQCQNVETFTPKIYGFYRPHIRSTRLYIESFMNKYSPEYFIKLLKKTNIY